MLRDRTNPRARLMFSMAMWMAALVARYKWCSAISTAGNSYHHQPAKVAAMEGHFDSVTRAPSILFGWPDAQAGETKYEIGIPGLASLYLAHDLDATVTGLKDLREHVAEPTCRWCSGPSGDGRARDADDRPRAVVPLPAYKGRLFETPWLHRFASGVGGPRG